MPAPRRILRVTGTDREKFLQGLVTNDVARLADGLVYAAMLTPQGKYLADFLLVPGADEILIDVAEPVAEPLRKRLAMYRLRAKVEIEATDLAVAQGFGPPPAGAFADPRHPALGWRAYGAATAPVEPAHWDRLRVRHLIPESCVELLPDETFPLEAGLERLNGLDFRKGCYVGQEVTARMKHKTALRKGLARVSVEGAAPPGTAITAGAKTVGRLFTQADGAGIAYLRFDQATGPLLAETARLALLQE